MRDTEALLLRTACGDQAAFASLYDALVPEVHRLVSLVLPEPDAAGPVVHDTFVGLWRTAGQPGFTDGLPVRAWALADAFRRARGVTAA